MSPPNIIAAKHTLDEPAAAQSARPKNHLRLLSYNIQVAIASTRLRHYVTQSWKHILPHQQSLSNLDKISSFTRNFDVVALQEVDSGSLRSQYINQVQYLAEKCEFPFWYYQTNRNLGKFAQACNGLLSHIEPASISEHKLPGLVPGRGVIMVQFGQNPHPLIILLAHLALGKRARMTQLAYIAELANAYEHVVLMGDLNCQPQSQEMKMLLNHSNFSLPIGDAETFPSWRPTRKLDYILVTPSLEIKNVQVLNHVVSDHLPVALDILLPENVRLVG